MKTPICDRDCFRCRLNDCCNDAVEDQDIQFSRAQDREIQRSRRTEAQLANNAACRRYYQRNKAKIAEQKKSYYLQNRTKIIARTKAYKETHREETNARDRARYAKKRHAETGRKELT